MKIVILEADSLGQDMVFTPFEALGEVVIYPTTTADEMEEKTKDADVIVANKVPICESTIGKAQNLKLVCLTATGFNNLDGDYLKKKGIAAYNVAGYSTNGVAQHTFALLFYVLEKLNYYDNYVKSGEYARGTCFSTSVRISSSWMGKPGELSVLAQLETGWRRSPRHLAAILSATPLPGKNTIQSMNR